MLDNFNLECRKCRSQDCSVEIQELCFPNTTDTIKIKCNKCDNEEVI